ncbi:MAG: competence/damage-inducible protein A [bacterium]
MKSALVSIGDELITGSVTDENSAWLSDGLLAAGIETALHLTVGDDLESIVDALRLSADRAEHVIVTGGLGPTEDDLTREAACSLAGVELQEDASALSHIRRLFESIGRQMTDNNRKQAMIPAGSELIENPAGTAPGFVMVMDTTAFYFLPGVPRECRLMFESSVLPRLEGSADRVYRYLLFRTFGMTESGLDQELQSVSLPEGVKLSYRAVFPEIQLKVIAGGESESLAWQNLEGVCREIRSRLGEVIYSEDGTSLEEVVVSLLAEHNMMVALAESCTGGLVCKRLTDVAGSSAVVDRGFVTYSNQAKIELLGVAPETLEEHGAVSAQTARAMARGALESSRADLALSITGIAGPSGGTSEKPVGTVHMALADRDEVWDGSFMFGGRGRSFCRELTAQAALEIIRRWVLGLGEFVR